MKVNEVRKLFDAENKRSADHGWEKITVIKRDEKIVVRQKVSSRHSRFEMEWLESKAQNLGLTGKASLYSGRVGLYSQTWAEFEVSNGHIQDQKKA